MVHVWVRQGALGVSHPEVCR
eukprot:COSAG03_NODE_25894_length_262_cov_8.165644_1_plen_20_part_01